MNQAGNELPVVINNLVEQDRHPMGVHSEQVGGMRCGRHLDVGFSREELDQRRHGEHRRI